jgi:hypothetical protein
MINKGLMVQIKWLLFALVVSFVLVGFFDGAVLLKSSNMFIAQNTFLGLNLFLEILIFFVFSTFVVFGIKGFFEMYSQKLSNIITFVSGVLMMFVIIVLLCQIVFQV